MEPTVEDLYATALGALDTAQSALAELCVQLLAEEGGTRRQGVVTVVCNTVLALWAEVTVGAPEIGAREE